MKRYENNELKELRLYIKPTYSVLMPPPSTKRKLTAIQVADALKNLKENKPNPQLSEKARRRLINSVNWLIASAKKKRVFSKQKNKNFFFKVNFLTLTIPYSDKMPSDSFLKNKILHNFINTMMYRHNLRNYVWRAETQANGSIHFHFITDTFMDWNSVKEVWNRILLKNNLLTYYQKKHSNMSVEEYISEYSKNGNVTTDQLIMRYKKGVSENWVQPNSTDIHAVYKVRDIGAYVSKYMSKNEEERRAVNGRLWSCSYSISRANKEFVSIPFDIVPPELDCFGHKSVHYKSIEIEDVITRKKVEIGSIFFYPIDFLRKHSFGYLREKYQEILWKINVDYYSNEKKFLNFS